MLTGPPRRRRARPVADAPIDALLDRTEDLTKGWLLALLERAPLDDAPRILAADLTREGPRVCAAMLRAIADETDHRRLEPGGALEPLVARVGELAGAAGAAATSLAVDALQGVMWSALRSELREPDPGPDHRAGRAPVPGHRADARGGARARRRAGRPPPISASRAGSGRGRPSAEPAPAADPRRGRAARRGRRGRARPARTAPPPAAAEPAPARPAPAPPRPARAGAACGALRPERRRAGAWRRPERRAAPAAALWVDALEDEIRAAADAPLSLLLAELEDADRVLAVETDLRVRARGLRRLRPRRARGRPPPGHPRLRDRRAGLDHRPRHRPPRRPGARDPDRRRGARAASPGAARR